MEEFDSDASVTVTEDNTNISDAGQYDTDDLNHSNADNPGLLLLRKLQQLKVALLLNVFLYIQALEANVCLHLQVACTSMWLRCYCKHMFSSSTSRKLFSVYTTLFKPRMTFVKLHVCCRLQKGF